MDFNSILLFSKQFALVWFFLIFVGIVVVVYWPGNKKRFEDEGRKILDDDNNENQP
ncbi:MAG: cbb3-type cytochrome c oxidase subunit 3 [Magnetococcales bacterium]|nr:cbb3-type cytochrome c oxidase subunit 3 [Magnetococcales bacterium]